MVATTWCLLGMQDGRNGNSWIHDFDMVLQLGVLLSEWWLLLCIVVSEGSCPFWWLQSLGVECYEVWAMWMEGTGWTLVLHGHFALPCCSIFNGFGLPCKFYCIMIYGCCKEPLLQGSASNLGVCVVLFMMQCRVVVYGLACIVCSCFIALLLQNCLVVALVLQGALLTFC